MALLPFGVDAGALVLERADGLAETAAVVDGEGGDAAGAVVCQHQVTPGPVHLDVARDGPACQPTVDVGELPGLRRDGVGRYGTGGLSLELVDLRDDVQVPVLRVGCQERGLLDPGRLARVLQLTRGAVHTIDVDSLAVPLRIGAYVDEIV